MEGAKKGRSLEGAERYGVGGRIDYLETDELEGHLRSILAEDGVGE